jgi:hypothetical protein
MVAAETSHALQDRTLRDRCFELALNHAKEKRHVAQELHGRPHARRPLGWTTVTPKAPRTPGPTAPGRGTAHAGTAHPTQGQPPGGPHA